MKKWIIGTFASIFVAGGLIVPFRDQLWAMWDTPEKQKKTDERVNVLLEQTTTIGRWVESRQGELDNVELLRQRAPEGYYWDSDKQSYEEAK